MSANFEVKTPAEGPKNPEAGGGVFGWIRWIRGKLRSKTDAVSEVPKVAPCLTQDTLLLLKTCTETLPNGPHKKAFGAIVRIIEGMTEEERKQIAEETARPGTVILNPEKENRDVLFLFEGTLTVHLEKLQETIHRPAPDVFGEMSAMLTGGKPTALVDALTESHLIRIPKSLFETMRRVAPELEEAMRTIMDLRLKQNRTLTELRDIDLNPAQELAEIAMLRLKTGDADKATLLDAVRTLADGAGDAFRVRTIEPGDAFVGQGDVLDSVRLILDGRANILFHGARLGTKASGDFIGDADVFTPARRSRFEYSAITQMTVLEIDPSAFLALRPKIESIVARQHAELLRRKRETEGVESVRMEYVSDKVLQRVHVDAQAAAHYVPRRPSGNDLIFECGRAEQVLQWLSVRGLLSYHGMPGWEIFRDRAGDAEVMLQRAADAPIIVRKEDLVDENLRPAVRHIDDTQDALNTYTKGGLTFEQARFLVARGLIPGRDPDTLHLANFGRSFAEIQQALSYIAEWAEKDDGSKERGRLATLLQSLLIDTTHQIGITSLMKDPSTRDIVLGSLEELLALPDVPTSAFKAIMEKETGMLREQFRADDVRWNVTGMTRRATALRAHLLTHPQWGDLFALGSAEPTPKQAQLLEKYADMLDRNVCPVLVQWMQDILAPMRTGDAAFPVVTGRTKSAAGILDKMRRQQRGNRGREARGDYLLADVPDAVGARVIVKDAVALEQAMILIESALKDRIYEKDDFYGNVRKQVRGPYRLVTYTVRCQGIPAEIQLQTLSAAVIANLDHDIIYKPYVPASQDERELIDSLHRRSAVRETEVRQALSASKRLPPTARPESLETPAMRHLFQSASPEGVCICTYVVEGESGWERDLSDARDYFRWHKNGGASVTMHQGASVIDCCACIGAPTWREFRALVLKRTKERSKVPAAIGLLEREGVPLFVLEEFARELETEANEAAFLKLVRERYTLDECKGIEHALAVMKRAHAGQSYANDKVDAQGNPVYPSSLLLKSIPYANHCVQTARMSVECGLSAESVQAELLHDTIEDNPAFTEEIVARETSPAVAARVQRMSKGPNEAREAYMQRVTQFTGEDKINKALDRYHNLLRAFNLRDSQKYLDRIINESKTIFAGDFAPNAALSKYAVRFQMLLEAVEKLRDRKFGTVRESER